MPCSRGASSAGRQSGSYRRSQPGQKRPRLDSSHFDVFDEWFRHPDYEGCFFTNALLESRDWPIGTASMARLMNVRAVLRGLAEDAGARDPDELAAEWQTLLWGSIVGPSGGDIDAAERARKVAELLLQSETSS